MYVPGKIASVISLVILPVFLQAQIGDTTDTLPTPTARMELSGFVVGECYYDTRRMEESTTYRGLLRWPQQREPDANGADINQRPNLQLLGLHSRLRLELPATPIGRKAYSSAVFEVDMGASGSPASKPELQLRKAMVNIHWDSVCLSVGQNWHPASMPGLHVLSGSWGGYGAVMAYSFSPQVRLRLPVGAKTTFNLYALAQQQFASQGPSGFSPEYQRQTGLPELHAQLITKGVKDWQTGIAAGYLWLSPKSVTLTGERSTKSLGSYQFLFFSKYESPSWQWRFYSLLGQNLTHLSLLGGYIQEDRANIPRYTNLHTGAVWSDVSYHWRSSGIGLFTGVTRNLGAAKSVSGNVEEFSLAPNIAFVNRLAGRYVFKREPFQFAAEILRTGMGYGPGNTRYSPQPQEKVHNWRLHFMCIRSF